MLFAPDILPLQKASLTLPPVLAHYLSSKISAYRPHPKGGLSFHLLEYNSRKNIASRHTKLKVIKYINCNLCLIVTINYDEKRVSFMMIYLSSRPDRVTCSGF